MAKKKNQTVRQLADNEVELLFGKKKSFAASEAYKLLRTNIQFSFSTETKCPVIGVTSSLRGEGKSTTSINLAIALAETGKRVLLIDADMRLPSVAAKLNLELSPGLSNLLVQQRAIKQKFSDVETLDILTAGDTPPNPSELLGSQRMETFLNEQKQNYAYIVVDLPPVTSVSDALSVSRVLDGLLLVVRGDYASKKALNETLRQMKLADVHIIGFVYTFAGGRNKGYYSKYGKYGKYGKYSKDYGYGYGEKSKSANANSEKVGTAK